MLFPNITRAVQAQSFVVVDDDDSPSHGAAILTTRSFSLSRYAIVYRYGP
ncbi:hypothetical protein AZE42_09417 [Rhizopogon vesiculosus]|uniref:Uncharacterized protein n=1 Tax=Rhizopogon vesiculosus TaxID=180088 RepID=A0A1J8PH33_9AGAM|nr:hypothetical protein AZE42_09417 [Rhizopogon vesiculosus]